MCPIFECESIRMVIDHDRCTGSGECVEACPMDILVLEGGKSVCIDIESCIQCCACQNACPMDAIDHGSCD